MGILIDEAQKCGHVILVVKANDSTVHGFLSVVDYKTTKCVSLLSNLPSKLANKYNEFEARGVCKVDWKVRNQIPLANLKMKVFQLKDGSELKLRDCPPGCEFTEPSGRMLVDAIKNENSYTKIKHKRNTLPTLFFSPNGYQSLFNSLTYLNEKTQSGMSNDKNSMTQEYSLSTEITRSRGLTDKNFHRYTKSALETMSYNEYLICHQTIKNKAKTRM